MKDSIIGHAMTNIVDGTVAMPTVDPGDNCTTTACTATYTTDPWGNAYTYAFNDLDADTAGNQYDLDNSTADGTLFTITSQGPSADAGDEITVSMSVQEMQAKLVEDRSMQSSGGQLAARLLTLQEQFDKIKDAMFNYALNDYTVTSGSNYRHGLPQPGAGDSGDVPYATLGLSAEEVTDPWGNVIKIIVNDVVSGTGAGSGLFIDKVGSTYQHEEAFTLIGFGPNQVLDSMMDGVYHIDDDCNVNPANNPDAADRDDICEKVMISDLIGKMVDAGIMPYTHE